MTPGADGEVIEALDRAGLRARAMRDVTTIRFPGIRRATFRVDLESGDTIKARRLEDEPTVERLVTCRRRLPDAFVPAFSHHGRVVLEHWVPGRALGSAPPPAALVVESAELLAVVHSMEIPAGHGADAGGTTDWRSKTESWLRALTDGGALDAAEADRVRRDLERHDPGRTPVGLGHFDLCGENMILDESGRVRVVDNERVGIGSYGFDLARTWYRWSLPENDWQLFRRTYTARVGREAPFSGFEFWCRVVLVQSARLRLGTAPAHLSVPLDRLHALIEGATAGDKTP